MQAQEIAEETQVSTHPIVSSAEWVTARKSLLALRGPARSMSLSSDDEGMVVDEMMAADAPSVSGALSDRQPATTREPPPPPPPLPAPVPVLSQRPESGAGRAISILMLLSALSLGGYAVWLYVLHPPGQPAVVQTPTPKARASAAVLSPAAITSARAGEADAAAEKISHGQELLAKGDAKGALDAFKDALKTGTAVARSVLSHMSIAIEEPSGPCKLTGISRPRPYSIELPVSRPSLLHSSAGTVFAWIDNHQDPKKKQAYAVLLDDALRRTATEVPLTPEVSDARQAQLLPAGDKYVL